MVNTVGSHLKPYQLEMIGKYNCQSDVQINADIVPKMSRNTSFSFIDSLIDNSNNNNFSDTSW